MDRRLERTRMHSSAGEHPAEPDPFPICHSLLRNMYHVVILFVHACNRPSSVPMGR